MRSDELLILFLISFNLRNMVSFYDVYNTLNFLSCSIESVVVTYSGNTIRK